MMGYTVNCLILLSSAQTRSKERMGFKHIHFEDVRILYLKEKDEKLSHAIDLIGEMSYWKPDDYFVFLVDEIAGQMLSNQVAKSLREKLHILCKNHVTPEVLLRISREELHGIGLANSKVHYIHNLASLVINGNVKLDELELFDDATVINYLTAIKGIGPWTAKMFLLFALDRPDILPFEDKAFLQAYKWLYETTDVSVEAVKRTCCNWSPYSSLAARYMYRVLDGGFTQRER